MRNDLPYTVFKGLRVTSIVGCFPEMCFSVFRGAGGCVVAKNKLETILFSPLGPVLLVLIIILIKKCIITSLSKNDS